MERGYRKKSKTPCVFGGTTMKTLLAKETSTEASAKERSLSLVAKLMGLNELPSPQPTAKRIEKSFRHYQLDNKTTTEQQHFKDVYEDPEASLHVRHHVYSPQLTAKRESSKLELSYMKERCDEMIRESIAIKTKLKRVESSPDLMLSFLHNDRQDIPFSPLCHDITVLKPSDASRYGSSGKVLKEAVNCRVHVSHQRNGYFGCYCHRSSGYQLEKKAATVISPTDIVVLKPNVAQIYSDKRFLHSADECRKNIDSEFSGSEAGAFRRKSIEARETARRITSQLKDGFESGHVNVHGSSYIAYASASARDTEMMAISVRSSFRSNISESVVVDAKKRMSQRWKTNRYKDVGMVGKCSILEETRSVPNSETRAYNKTGHLRGPVGVSDGYLRSTSRLRSLPPFHNRSQKISDYHEADADEKIMVYDKFIHRGKNKGMKGNYSHRDDLRFKTLQCSSHALDNILTTETYFEDKGPAEQESLIYDIHDATANEASVLEFGMLRDAESSAADEDGLNSQDPEPESCYRSKEFDQHGQLSVSEVPPTDDLSSDSDCFERVSSKLHELRKQLHLLKMQSKAGTTYDIPNDEDTEQRSSSCTVSESENLESAYLTDLLQDARFYDHDPYAFITKWYSADNHCPVDIQLSDHLEKKYSQVSKTERRLFHDRLNEALFLLSKTLVSWLFDHRGTRMTLTEIGLKDELQKLLAKQEKEANREFEDISIDDDLDWFKPVSEIDIVGKEVAEVLVNELVLEIISKSRCGVTA